MAWKLTFLYKASYLKTAYKNSHVVTQPYGNK